MKVICTDDSYKPNDISIKNWVVKNNIYTVVKMCISKITNDRYFVLEEIQPKVLMEDIILKDLE